MYVFKWANLNTRMVFRPDDGGGSGSEAATPPSAGGDGGSAESPPAAAPSTSTPAAEPAAKEAVSFDWSALGSSDDLDHQNIEIPQEPKAPVEAKPLVPPVVEPPKAAPPPAQAPVAPPQAAVAQQPAAEAEGPPLSASDPWKIAEAIEANRDMAIAHLAQSKFALSEQDIKDLDTDVTAAVPRLLARVFVESQVSMQKFLAQAVPGMMKKYNTVNSANESAEKKFFDTHKALDINDPKHRETTVRIASLYRQANPGIPLEQLIAEVGPMVMASLRVNAPVQQQAVAAPVPRGGTPFRPAVNGGGGLSPSTEPANEWAGLGRNYDE